MRKRFAEFFDLNESEHKILHTKIYFFWLIHAVLAHRKLLIKDFSFSLFSSVLRVKNSVPILFARSFWLIDMWKYATKQVLLHIKK